MVQGDCLLADQAILSSEEDMSPLGNHIEDIKDLLNASLNIFIPHANRTTNHVAHRLAQFSFDSKCLCLIVLSCFGIHSECLLLRL